LRTVPEACARRRTGSSLTLSFSLALAVVGFGVLAAPTAAHAQSPTNVQAFMTLYGWADNSPPGPDIAHPCIHSTAGGIGTYADPITFATDVNELGWCQIIYVPYMQRYFIHEDECSECDANWNSQHKYRFDMWAGGDASSTHRPERKALMRCESTWTRANSIDDPNNPTVIVDPPSTEPVTTAPIFSPPGSCWSPISIINPGKQSAAAGNAVSLQISAVDHTSGQTLTYSATGLPMGVTIDSTSGLISGIPTTRGRAKTTVTAADSADSASVSFVWKVTRARTR
jgi:hypothetical protein